MKSHSITALARTVSAALALSSCAAFGEGKGLDALSLEELLDVNVYSASKFNQKASDAPASMSVITAEEIRAYGHRTLTDVLRSVRGVYAFGDRQYDFVGMRGFGRPGDYNSRELLLIDGHRTNDAVYDSALTGTEALLDVDLIERVEITRGPGSVLYGSSAFFGVINIITKRAGQFATGDSGGEIAASAGSGRSGEARVTLAKLFANGGELMTSVSGLHSRGNDLYFADYDTPAGNNGRTQGTDYTRNERLYANYRIGGFDATLAHAMRVKGSSNGLGGATFNDPANRLADSSTYLDLGYEKKASERLVLSGRTNFAWYGYNGASYYDFPPVVETRDKASAAWYGFEGRAVWSANDAHRLSLGIETRNADRVTQRTYDVDPYTQYVDDRRALRSRGVYLQDEWKIHPKLTVSLGARFDRQDERRVTSPRIAAVYKPDTVTTWKALYGTAFRAANVYERFYAYPGFNAANPNLAPERIRTGELHFERYLGNSLRTTLSGYRYQILDLIDTQIDPVSGLNQFQNTGRVNARGIEAEIEWLASSGARVRGSWGAQTARYQNDALLDNSPQQMLKLNAMSPLGLLGLHAGFEWQYLGSRRTFLDRVPAHNLANVTLSRPVRRQGVEVSFGIYNLLGKKYLDPVLFDPANPNRDRLEQDGRSLRLKLLYRF